MKIHLCCGTVYLKDYINIDIQGFIKGTYAAENIQLNETTFDKYYTRPLKNIPVSRRGHFVIDKKVDILMPWPFEDNSVEEVVMIQAIEHFLKDEGEFIVSEIYRVLNYDGKFVFDFPDVAKTIEMYAKNDFDYAVRLLYCNHKDQYSIHKTAYNKVNFQELLFKMGLWKSIKFQTVVKHDYPVIGGVAIK